MNWQVIKNRVTKIFAYLVTSVLFLLIAGFLVLQMPPVQHRLVSFYLRGFSDVTGFKTTIKGFKMLWFDRLELTGVTMYDPEGNEMIRSSEILLNFKLSHLIDQSNFNIDGIVLDSAHVYLTKIADSDTSRDLNINVLVARINEKYKGSGGSGKAPKINIGETTVTNSQFSYVDQYRDSIKQGFNYNQFSVAIDEAELRGFVIQGDTTEFDVRTLIANDIATGFRIKEMSTFFRLSQSGMEFNGVDLRAGESIIKDTIQFRFNGQRELSDFIHKVRIHANLNNTIINQNDLALFAPGVEQIGKPVHVNGIVNGRVDKFKITEMDFLIGNTRLKGTLEMDGLPVVTETFITLSVKDSQVDPVDLSFIVNDDFTERLKPLGKLHVDGQFLGYPTDFVANGTLVGKLGTIRSDINFKVNEENFNLSEYSGRLVLGNFSLGRYFGDTALFQTVGLDGQIKGKGLTKADADFKLNGKISHVGINGYNYKNIVTNARFATSQFNGFLQINDPNLEFEAEGSIDLREGVNRIQLEARLDTAYLHKLKLTEEEVFLHTVLKADVTGLSLDSLNGVADFHELGIRYQDQSLSLDQIHLEASRHEGDRVFKVESTLADAEIKGDYTFSNVTMDLQTLAKEISLNIRNNQREINNYYARKNYRPQNYEAEIFLVIKDIKPVARLLNADLTLSARTAIQGKFTSGYTSIFNLYGQFDSLQYNGVTFLNSTAELTASKISDSTAVLAMATITSESQQVTKSLKTRNLLAEGIWNGTHIDFGIDADQEGNTNMVRVNGAVDFEKDSTVISMNPSKVKLLEREWTFGDGNFISLRGDDVLFNNVSLNMGGQSIALHGRLSDDPEKLLTLNVDHLDLSIFNVITLATVNGVMDAKVDVSNFYGKMNVQNAVSIKALTVSDFLIGDLQGNNIWDTTANRFNVDFNISRGDRRLVSLTGDFTPDRKESPLDLNAYLQQADLKILEPFLADIFSHIGGTVSGNFKITGRLENPLIDGAGEVGDGQLMVNYLKTIYKFKGTIGLTPTSIYFQNIEMTDPFKSTGILNGAINHKNFNSMSINMNADFKNFQVLNTTIRDNSLFYGQGFASGNVEFVGPINNLAISSTARTEKNTRIYVPISGTSSVDKKDFINFVNFSDTTFQNKIEQNVNRNRINLTGVTFDLNLDVTPDAYCEIIFDLKAGDIIRGRGNGELKLQMDTKGEFNMFGPFEFTEGWYNFTLYDIINKEFEIQRGSKITWYGDPYQAVLNINASYNQNASLAPIIQDPNVNSTPQLRRNYPVQVLLKIEGLMLAFQVSFDIQAKDLPRNIQIAESNRSVNLDIEFAAFKNKLDEQELYRQVFSLIVLRKFSPPESFNTSGSVVNSVSELLSNQLSYWMSQVDQNLEIDVDLNIMDDDAFNTFQLRASYTLFNGRLRLTGDGTYNNPNAAQRQTSPSSVAGDWTVDYMLTPDGKLRIKMFSRTNVNPILSSVNNQNTITTGASLIHTQSFDEIKELWRARREKKKRQEKDDQTKAQAKDAKKEDDVPE